VDELEPRPHSTVLPHWVITAVCTVPNGAHPSYAHGYTTRDNAFYSAWDEIARDRDGFRAWMEEHVMAGEGATV
jgi:glutaconate CoA-transferase subunit A